jgi:hypothetical protein
MAWHIRTALPGKPKYNYIARGIAAHSYTGCVRPCMRRYLPRYRRLPVHRVLLCCATHPVATGQMNRFPLFLFTRGRGAKVSWIRKIARKNKKPGCLFSDPGLVRLYLGEF